MLLSEEVGLSLKKCVLHNITAMYITTAVTMLLLCPGCSAYLISDSQQPPGEGPVVFLPVDEAAEAQ